jgi:PAS domain S-box-containing protein
VETASDIIFKTDLNGNFTFVNPAVIHITGYEEEEIIGRQYTIMIRPDMHDNALKFFGRQLVKGLKNTYSEYPIITKDGQELWLGQNTQLIMEDGHVVGFQVVARDITERKRAEEALRQSEERYRTILNEMEEGYQEVDLAGNFTFFNEPFLKIFGYSRDEMMGTNFSRYAAGEAIAKKVYRAYNQMYKTGLPIKNYEWDIIRKDGARRTLDFYASMLKDLQDRPIGFRGIVRDVTDNKHIEERLNRAEKMEALGTLASGVAHDLNNVLGVLSGYSELLMMEIPEGNRSRGHVEKILKSTQKGAAIIEDLLTLARRGVTVSDVINLNNIISDFLKAPVLEKIKDYHPGVTFSAECDNNLLNIKGSPLHLEKTLMNLVSNAAEAISGGGEVTIRTENRYLDKALRGYDEIKEGDYAVLTVSDTGMGIPAEDMGKIFEPFYTKKTMGRSGTGLGLAIVWGTVKDHNGYIDVQTGAGQGTTFTLYFPVTREEMIAPQQQKAPMEQYMGKGESVLVVDDVAEQRDVAARLLTSLGYEVHAVSSGEEAVEYLKWSRVDIFILDMIMAPGIDGLETYKRVLKINPKQKAIIVSGYSETERVREAQRLGAGAYLKKPYIMEKIGVVIREELDR